MDVGRRVDTVIVGAGQAGLIVSGLLRSAGREHVLLERRSTLGGGWQDRWDAFQLVSPNWTTSVAGFPYRGHDPDGFMGRDELIDHWRAYAAAIAAPVELETDVTAVDPLRRGTARFRVTTTRGVIDARTVVVAGGPFQVPHRPPIGDAIDRSIAQVHSHDYRNPDALPPGGVLLVGSGQSGVQLAEELMAAGRPVAMAVGHCGRAPRAYRGRDFFWWLRELGTRGPEVGLSLPTAAGLPDPRLRFACNPQLSGHGGGHETNLRVLAGEGLRLFGRLEAAAGTRLRFADDLESNLAFADAWFHDRFRERCDAYAERMDLELPPDEATRAAGSPAGEPELDQPELDQPELDFAAEGFSTVLWTSGYRPAFGWLHLDVLDDHGLPRSTGGLTAVPGLAFIGTPWLIDMGSANLVGVERDAAALVASLLPS